VIAPANTGKDSNSKIVVIITDHTNNGIRSKVIPFLRILIAVVIKFTDPKIDEIPARCKEKIAKSTDAPLCAILDDRGG
jgi:hypothetical protein